MKTYTILAQQSTDGAYGGHWYNTLAKKWCVCVYTPLDVCKNNTAYTGKVYYDTNTYYNERAVEITISGDRLRGHGISRYGKFILRGRRTEDGIWKIKKRKVSSPECSPIERPLNESWGEVRRRLRVARMLRVAFGDRFHSLERAILMGEATTGSIIETIRRTETIDESDIERLKALIECSLVKHSTFIRMYESALQCKTEKEKKRLHEKIKQLSNEIEKTRMELRDELQARGVISYEIHAKRRARFRNTLLTGHEEATAVSRYLYLLYNRDPILQLLYDRYKLRVLSVDTISELPDHVFHTLDMLIK